MQSLRPLAPAVFLLLWSALAGTFTGSADAAFSLSGHLSLVVVVAASGAVWRDPLRLGRGGNLLLLFLVVSLCLSFYSSPVPRAGRVALPVAAAFLLVPRFVEHSWLGDTGRRRGLLALAAVVAGLSGASLVAIVGLDTPGASFPLGHHNLLAAWLVTLLPLAVLPWREGGAARAMAIVAGVLGIAALVATRSLGGLAGFIAAATPMLWRRHKGLSALTLVLALAAAGPRISEVARGEDPSAGARLVYLKAGWQGFLERPVLGWGPGSARWTIARFLVPEPGLDPPGEVVADPHSWPLVLAYETGAAGLVPALLAGAVFLRRRSRESPADAALRSAALCGLLGFLVTSLFTRPWAAPALPLAALLVLGALLAASRNEKSVPEPSRGGLIAVAILLAVLLAPADLAHLAYDRALAATDAGRERAELRTAVRFDPGFPLYRLRLAALEGDAPSARSAAEDAGGVAPFWLLAGVVARESGEPWADEAFLRACRLDPLGALAPFHLALEGDESLARLRGARAILAEPRLLAAWGWAGRPGLREESVEEAGRCDGVEPGWREELTQLAAGLPEPAGASSSLSLEMDGGGSTALSLHVFRRRPWPLEVDRVRLAAGLLPSLDLPAVSRLPSTDARTFERGTCVLWP